MLIDTKKLIAYLKRYKARCNVVRNQGYQAAMITCDDVKRTIERLIRKTSQGEQSDSADGKKAKVSLPSGTQQIKDAILLLAECHRKVPACKSKPQEWPSCGCLHCRIEYFILQNGNH